MNQAGHGRSCFWARTIRAVPGTLSLVNSTISGNRAVGAGGGIWVRSGSIAIAYSTLVDNGAREVTPGFWLGGGGLRLEATASGSLHSSVLADNVSGSFGPAIPANCTGPVKPTSLGHNLEDADTCELSGPGDLPDTDPLLGPLADNGGPTLTHALLPGSPAVDAGDDAGCPPTDQRRVARPQGPHCDIGAFEVGRPARLFLTPPFDVNPPGSSHTVTARVEDPVGKALEGVTVRVLVTSFTTVASGACVSGADGTCVFTYRGPPGGPRRPTLRVDLITAFADIDADGTQDLGEPFDTAVKLWFDFPVAP
jgi:hypothetical protein